MANVKISDLPAISNFSLNNVVIVNDTATTTTCKGTLSQTLTKSGNINFTPASGITLTVDGSSSDTLEIPHTITAAKIGYFGTRSSVIFTNNTAEYARLEFTVQNNTAIYAYNSPLIPIQAINYTLLKGSTGEQLTAPFYLRASLNGQNNSVLIVVGTDSNGFVKAAYLAPNTAWNASYLMWMGFFVVGNAVTII